MNQQESIDRSTQLLRQAIPLMVRQNTALHPISYAVWYEYLSGTNPDLNRELEALTSGDARLDEDQTLTLYNRHIGGIDNRTAERLRDRFQAVLMRMNSSATAMGRQAIEYQSALEEFGTELAGTTDAGEALISIERVLRQTGEMERAVSDLRDRLEESRLETEQLRDELTRSRQESVTDGLTGLINRKGFDLALESALQDPAGGGGELCLAIADLDNFKAINDSYGHLAGDRILQAVAGILRANVKGKDTAARFGGEEFVLLLPDTQLDGARGLIERIRQSVAQCQVPLPDSPDHLGAFTISFGATAYHAGESVESFVARADHALYVSKKRGRNCVTVLR